MRMNPEVKKMWTEALRSGKYKQGRGYLYSEGKYCCLGVLREIAPKEMRKSPGVRRGALSRKVMNWAGLSEADPIIMIRGFKKASEANDCLKLSFDEIADLIENNL